MDKLTIGVLGSFMIVLIIMFSACVGALFGAFTGWIVNLTPIGTWITKALESFHINGLSLVDFGALLGFVSSFFRRNTNTSKE